MQRFLSCLALVVLLSGCGTSPVDSESTREVVLQYLGGDVGTAGPFGKGGKKELDVLTAADRHQAEQLIDAGASMFLVYGANAANPNQAGGVSRVVLVQHGKIVADLKAEAKPQSDAK